MQRCRLYVLGICASPQLPSQASKGSIESSVKEHRDEGYDQIYRIKLTTLLGRREPSRASIIWSVISCTAITENRATNPNAGQKRREGSDTVRNGRLGIHASPSRYRRTARIADSLTRRQIRRLIRTLADIAEQIVELIVAEQLTNS